MFEDLIADISVAAMNLEDKVRWGINDVLIELGIDDTKPTDPNEELDIVDPAKIEDIAVNGKLIERMYLDESKYGFAKRYRKYWMKALEDTLINDKEFSQPEDPDGREDALESLPWEVSFINSMDDEEKFEMISHGQDNETRKRIAKMLGY